MAFITLPNITLSDLGEIVAVMFGVVVFFAWGANKLGLWPGNKGTALSATMKDFETIKSSMEMANSRFAGLAVKVSDIEQKYSSIAATLDATREDSQVVRKTLEGVARDVSYVSGKIKMIEQLSLRR